MAHDEQDCVDGWQTYFTWIDNLRRDSEVITGYEGDPSFRDRLLSLKTIRDKFELVWNDETLHNEIARIYKVQSSAYNRKKQLHKGKSFKESKLMRELGNKSFKDGKFMDALTQYTQSIRYAPYPNSDARDDSLALAFANRSAALYSLTRYRPCLLDIDLAMKYGYPEANMFKLLIRKVKCLHILSVWTNDVEQIKDRLRNLLKNRDTKEFVKIEIQAMFDFLEQTQPEDMDKDELDIVDETMMKLSNVSKSLTQAADCVEMSYDNAKGRYLITNRDVSFGRLLVAEEPYVCNLAPHKRDHYCYNCFGRLHSSGLGCMKCTQVLYCSEECLEAKSDTHSYECDGFLDYQEDLGISYLIAHIMFKIDFNLNCIPVHTKKTADKKSLDDVLNISPGDWPDLVYKNNYASVLSLMDHLEDYEYDELFGFILTASYLMTAFVDKFSCQIPTLNEKDAQLVTGSIILKHLLQLQTNLISIVDQNLKGLTSVGSSLNDVQEKPIGVGIYPTISLLNHSCSPNILSLFHRNRFIARAAKSLECGTEINYCYGPSVARMSKKDRQRNLKEQYFFTCDCECCVQGKENESRALLCTDCRGPVVYNQDLSHKCMNCRAENLDVSIYLKQISELRSSFDELRSCETNDAKKIQNLKNLEASLAKLLYWRNPIFMQIKSELIECAESMEDMKLALKFCEEELELNNKTFGRDSYESIMTKLKLINIKWQKLYYSIEDAENEAAKLTGLEELRSLSTLTYETRGKLKDLLASTNILGAESSFESELRFLGTIQSSINNYLASHEPSERDAAQ